MEKIKIFVTVGSQKFQFDRLLRELDHINFDKFEIFAQVGYSTYKPLNYSFVDFLDREKFIEEISKSDLVITHAGTGAIISSLSYNKPVLAVSRLVKYKEHVDNHQTEILDVFVRKNYIKGIKEIDNLESLIYETLNTTFNKYKSNTNNFIIHLKGLIDNE